MSKRASTGAASVVIVAALTVLLVGCVPPPSSSNGDGKRGLEEQPHEPGAKFTSQSDAIGSVVEAERATIPTVLAQNPGVYADVAIDPLDNDGIEYSYRYAEQTDPVETSRALDLYLPSFVKACVSSIFPEMRQAGVSLPPKARITFYNADGSEIWSHTCTDS